MRYRKLDADGDYSFGNGQLDFMRDTPEAVVQSVATRLRLWLAEWFLDTEAGTPYQAAVLGKNSKESADIALRQRIVETPGVNELVSFSSTLDADLRKYSLSATIDTIYGPATLNEIL
jgi:hypothetical protein